MLEKSIIQEADLDRLKIKYAILEEFGMVVPGSNERVIASPPGSVTFYEDIFEAGIKFLLHQFIWDILDFYQVPLT